MKKKRVILTTASLASLSIVTLLTVFLSLAWFTHYAKVESKSEGEALVSYFAYGKGTKEDPYGITQPRHLYNLAWLQDMGKFNQDKDGDNKIDTAYFKLDTSKSDNNTIDMSKFSALPPIGTEQYPFVGSFVGVGKDNKKPIIRGIKISNDFSDYLYHPANVTAFDSGTNKVNQPHIVGFFGVVGEVGELSPTDYSSSALKISDFVLAGTSVTSSVTDTLVGIAAGYVNGTMENVGVTNASDSQSTLHLNGTVSNYSTTNRSFSHVSDYTLVGYAEDAYKDTVYRSVTNISNPYVEDLTYVSGANGDSEGWGGSIDMKSMYNHIKPLYENSAIYSYTSKSDISVTFDSSGNPVISETVLSTAKSPYRYTWPDSLGYDSYNSEKDSNGNVTAQYSFAKRMSGSSGTGTVVSTYLYLSGNTSETVTGEKSSDVTMPNSSNGTAPQVITDGSGDYLALQKEGIGNSSASNSGNTVWYFENGTIFTYDTYHHFAKTYLYDNSGTLSTSSSALTTWTYSSTANTLRSSLGHYLGFAQGMWRLSSTGQLSVSQYKISYTNRGTKYYIRLSNNRLMSTTSSSQAATFYTDNDGYFYTLLNGQSYYLTLGNTSSASYRATVTLSDSATGARFSQNGNNLIASFEGTTWYLYQYGSYAYSSSFLGTSYTFNTSTSSVNIDQTLSFQGNTTYSVAGADDTYSTGATYFPLNFESSSSSAVSSKNTGYVVSGAYESSGIQADIRVSQYTISDIKNSTTSSLIDSSKVYTIDFTGSHYLTDSSSYQKFSNSLSSINSILSSSTDSYLYGLHFMDASISKSHLITVPYASVEGTEYSNFQLPEDSIDFRLKEKGYVNFFAGTYYLDNDSFFSLHRIFRDSDNSAIIKEIKEISSVYEYTGSDSYGKAYSYVYQYADGKYSTPYWYRTVNGQRVKCKINTTTQLTEEEINATTDSAPTGYTEAFKTDWIKKQDDLTENAAYYFEIPMNDGEFALGSVSDGTGAYLMYLDIGGNASTIDRTKISEKLTVTTDQFSLPKGVALLKVATDTVKNLDSACVLIESGYTGTTVSLQRESDTSTNSDTIILTGYNADNCYPTYSKIGIKVTDTDKKVLDLKPLQSTTKNYYRLTTIDYSENSAEYTKTVIVYDPDKNTYTVKSYDQGGKEITNPTIYSDKGLSVGSEEYSSLFADMVNNTATYFTRTALGFTYQDTQASSFTFSYDFTFTARDTTTGKTFYQISVYTITVTNADGASFEVPLFIQGTPSSLVKVKELDASDVTEEDWKYLFQLVHDGTTITLPTDEEIILNP
ncbi:MAG: hypothetical protein PUA93_05955 [Eubacteriales bacterium]|nr:hypothetical protein [Eubacteriales bacterium]